jgi:prophage regulatory protein
MPPPAATPISKLDLTAASSDEPNAHVGELLPPPTTTGESRGFPYGVAPKLDRFLTLHEVKRVTSLGKSSIYEAVKAGSFPAPISIARGRVAWAASDIAQWQIAARKAMTPQQEQEKTAGVRRRLNYQPGEDHVSRSTTPFKGHEHLR